jgi:hypothetical protein
MEQLSLFGDFEQEETKEPEKAPVREGSVPKIALSLVPHHETILDCVKTGWTAKQICEHLIKEKGLSNETYSQGTPKIYPQLMIYLTHLQEQSLVQLVKVDPTGHGDFVEYHDQFAGRKCDAIFKMIKG